MRPFLRRISYSREPDGPLVVTAKSSIIGMCLNQFPLEVVDAVRGYRFNTPFEMEALLVGGHHGYDMHNFVVDDLRCRHAMEFMEVFMPNHALTVHARQSFPQLEPHILTSPMAQTLVDMIMDGELRPHEPFGSDEEIEL